MNDTPTSEFWTDERCYITELLNDAGYPEVSVARCRVTPDVTTERHALDVAEWYVIESGSGRVWVGDAPPRDVAPGDVVGIPAGVAQSIRNTGAADLVFLCVCAPRFSQDCYTSLE